MNPDSSLEHPAVIAWRSIGIGKAEPTDVEALQEEKQRCVYRLRGVGLPGGAVIAKRCPRDEATGEHTIYQKVLSRLPLSSVRLYGSVDEIDSKMSWLFLEDAGGEQYSPLRKDHRVLAGHWLGLLHISAARLIVPTDLRHRGPRYFSQFLRPACDIILESLSNPALNGGDVCVLRAIVSQCQTLAAHWRQLERFCDQMPQTVMHGDFKEDNMHVREGSSGRSLMVFDWNQGSWGVPALDLAKFLGYSVNPDITTYSSTVRDLWPFMDVPTIQRLGYVGDVFRCLVSIRWQAENLRYAWVEQPMSVMRVYNQWMDDLIQVAPWSDNFPSRAEGHVPKQRGWH